jgi:hypothetical protein
VQGSITAESPQGRRAGATTLISGPSGSRRQLILESLGSIFTQDIALVLQQGQSNEAVQLIGVQATEVQSQWLAGRLSEQAAGEIAQVLIDGLVQVTHVLHLYIAQTTNHVCHPKWQN